MHSTFYDKALILHFLYLARFFVIGVNDNTDQERCSADSVQFKYTDLLQYNLWYHAVRKTQDSTGPKHGEGNWTVASDRTGDQNLSDALSQNLEVSRIIKVTTSISF